MSSLFTQLKLYGAIFKYRIGMSPMCQYSSHDGVASNWYMAHLGSRAMGGVSFIMTECTAVSRTGCISPGFAGLG